MKNRKLAKRALNYLASLSQPLPDESDKAFYRRNRQDYQALLSLNMKGLGWTESELLSLAGKG